MSLLHTLQVWTLCCREKTFSPLVPNQIYTSALFLYIFPFMRQIKVTRYLKIALVLRGKLSLFSDVQMSNMFTQNIQMIVANLNKNKDKSKWGFLVYKFQEKEKNPFSDEAVAIKIISYVKGQFINCT